MSAQRPTVTVLGRGRVGRTLAGAWADAGVAVTLRAARDDAQLAAARGVDELVVLAVPDDAIAAVAERVGRGAGPVRPAVVHLSGASGFAPLGALRDAGFPVGIVHPFAPFPDVREPPFLRGVTFGVAASAPALVDRLEALATAVGGVPRRVDADGWVAYHAAAVMASNYLVVLAAQASALLEQAGFDAEGARDALIPLMRGTLDNLATDGVDSALSGPLRRGDVGTVERHLAWLDGAVPGIAATYRALARPGIDVAVGTGLGPDAAERLRRTVE